MTRSRRSLYLALMLAVLPAAAPAATSHATLQVRAVVRPYLQIQQHPAISTYTVRPADLARGYLDLPAAFALTVRTNVAQPLRGQIRLATAELVVTPAGGRELPAGTIELPAPPLIGRPTTYPFAIRVLLPAETRPGTYPFALELALSHDY